MDDSIFEAGSCTRCGADAPFRNSVGRCIPCHNSEATQRQAERKAQLAAMTRCEFCRRRGTMIIFGQIYICGRHKKLAEARITAHAGVFAMLAASPELVRTVLQR